jgi:hypothetical protein
MADRFIIFYEMNLKRCKSEYLTEDELGHEIARLMRRGACDVKVVIFDSERIPFINNSFKTQDATQEEREAVDKYIDSISLPTGINFDDSFYTASICDSCSNNPKNGGSGICNCVLGQPVIH